MLKRTDTDLQLDGVAALLHEVGEAEDVKRPRESATEAEKVADVQPH